MSFAVKLPCCNNYITIHGGISDTLFQIYEVLAGILGFFFQLTTMLSQTQGMQLTSSYCRFIAVLTHY